MATGDGIEPEQTNIISVRKTKYNRYQAEEFTETNTHTLDYYGESSATDVGNRCKDAHFTTRNWDHLAHVRAVEKTIPVREKERKKNGCS